MRHPPYFQSGLLGGLTSLPVIAISYLGKQWANLPFIPFDLFDWLARVLPGHVITLGIEMMVRTITTLGLGPIDTVAKRLEQVQGILIVIAAGVGLGVLQAYLLRHTAWPGHVIGACVGTAVGVFFVVIEARLGSLTGLMAVVILVWLALLLGGWNVGLGRWLAGQSMTAVVPAGTPETRLSRRAVLKLAGLSIGTAVLAGGAGALLPLRREVSGAGQPLLGDKIASSSLTSATPTSLSAVTGETPIAPTLEAGATRDLVAMVPGTRPEVTSDGQFYRIDIDAAPPTIDVANWQLQVSGLFDHPRSLSLADLMAYPATTQPITLSCISNPIGGDLIGTGYWTGVSLPLVLKDLGVRPEAKALGISAEDDFYESVAFQDMVDPRTLLVYGMNGSTLPKAHGFPLRIYIPNRYGMKQPKWITAIDALAQDGPGYWVDRGWDAEARPQIVSVIDVVAKDLIKDGQVPLGGIAWAGDRGIQKVEIQVDQGEWRPVRLRVPPLGHLTWVQWRYDWPAVPGQHVFQVRATDGTGTLQTSQAANTYPAGATGYHSMGVTI